MPLLICLRFGLSNISTCSTNVLPSGFAAPAGASPNAFSADEMEEAFRDGIVVAVAPSAHAGFEIVLAKDHVPFAAAELRSLIGVDHYSGPRFAPPYGREPGLQGTVDRHAGLGRPADHAA